ncbi:MAG: aminopeptidase N [Pseudomonadota bacterium]
MARTDTPQPIRLDDYTPAAFLVQSVDLTFVLDPEATRVTAKLAMKRNPDGPGGPLRLDGIGLQLVSASIDGAPIDVEILPEGLTCAAPDGAFTFESEVIINPSANTALEGLYMSNGMYCTQCEAEGFRKITFFPDRPDVMATYTVRVHSDLPVLLSNGNAVTLKDGFAQWHDPWPKPSYLFALVAGDLVAHSDRFTTSQGRGVDLNIYVREGDEDRCAYAMDALKRSMRWDEDTYGRAYDLDVFNVVAVDDFNMGAMENKGLNIFNAKYVLASPATATDTDYALIEAIIAHEYFHNWTGNRITCRDWFQLSLKEGLTVFREQQFSADMRGHAVKRIEDVAMLRARQFREDAGPLAHPVQPQSYVEINNFYTATIYEKGAELIGMLKALVGDEGYAKALDLYFERHDGEATTIEAWLAVFEDATQRDLSQFKRWYVQAGTPLVRVTQDRQGDDITLSFAQETPDTPGQSDKLPVPIPLRFGIIGPDGSDLVGTQTHEFTQQSETLTVSAPPGAVLSLNRGFGAPIILDQVQSQTDKLHLLAHDTDPFNRWEAGRDLASAILIDGADPEPYLNALWTVPGDETLEPSFRAMLLGLPSEGDLFQDMTRRGTPGDPTAIHASREALANAMARHLQTPLTILHDALPPEKPFSADPDAASRRGLRLAALGLLTRVDGASRAAQLFASADNMTDEIAALGALLRAGKGDEATATFYDKWQAERLVMDKWFALQITAGRPADGVDTAQRLAAHPDFTWTTPNRFRAVFGALANTPAAFHAPDGRAYALLADWILKLDQKNPQTAARMVTAFETWAVLEPSRKALAKAQLDRIAGTKDLSKDASEIASRLLKG